MVGQGGSVTVAPERGTAPINPEPSGGVDDLESLRALLRSNAWHNDTYTGEPLGS